MEIGILGSLVVSDGERRLEVGGGKQSALVALLALNAGRTVSTDQVIDALWGDQAPASALNSVRIYVSKLRKALGDGVLATAGRGYVLTVSPEQIDAGRFERLLAEGRELRAAGEAARAQGVLRAALGLWRGPALADFTYAPFAQTEIGRLEELRLTALEERLDADLALGCAAEVVPELEALVRENPLRERLRGLLMLALYRSGRQAEALEAYQQLRRLLADELALEPSPALKALEQQILNQDPALELPTAPPKLASHAERRASLAVIGAAAALLAASAAFILSQAWNERAPGLDSVAANAVGLIDSRSNRIVAQIPVGIRPASVVEGLGAVWVANLEDKTISRLDPVSKQLVKTISTGSAPTGLVVGEGRVWVARANGSLAWIDPRYNRLTPTADVAPSRFYRVPDHRIAVGFGSLWMTDSIGQLVRLDPIRGRVVSRIDVGRGARGVAVGSGSVWVANSEDGTISRVDSTGVVTATIPVGHGPTDVAFSEDAVWVTVGLDGVVARIDPETNAVEAVIPVDTGLDRVAAGAGAVWVADVRAGMVKRIDPHTNEISASIDLGASPGGLSAAGTNVWATAASELAGVPPGPKETEAFSLRVALESDPGVPDPALGLADAQLAYATCAKLLNYPDQPAPAGSQLTPEVAQSMPIVSSDGLTYTFTVRPGFRFSPPSGQPVTAQTFKDTIERTLHPKLASDELASEGAELLADVVGARAYMAGRAAHVAGVIARGDRLIVRLTRAVGDLPARIATPFFCAVPSGTPVDVNGVGPIPMAGPYYVASYVPGQTIVLAANPNYRGDRPSGPDEIVFAIGTSRTRALADVLAGRVDYAGDGVPLRQQRRLLARYGPGSNAARAGRQQFFVNPTLAVRYLALNTSRPLFSDASVRRAVSFAIDRLALARVWNRFFEAGRIAGGPASADYLPPGVRVSSRPAEYPPRPDVEKARTILGGGRRQAILYTCDDSPCAEHAAIVTRNLAAIGIDVVVKEFPVGVMYERAAQPNADWDLLRVGWVLLYPDPAHVLEPLLSAGSPWNFSRLRDPRVDERLRAVAKLTGPARARAYDALTRWIARRVAPLVAFESDTQRDLFAQRIGCQTFNPVYGMDLAALCLRR
jgi:YVTN family beta-propeller protein